MLYQLLQIIYEKKMKKVYEIKNNSICSKAIAII